ncbi:MAG: HAD-IA family hydrolase [Lachnospiraceae bacterium]|nr:HAD-IA family hydrolase [Lachnospiraceae bacterium]
MNRYDIAVFDVDGTLLDTSEGILNSVKHTIDVFGKPMPDPETLRSFIGPPIQNSFQKEYGLSKEEADTMAAEFRKVYKDIYLFGAVPYEGIYECMDTLRKAGVKLAVATYKRQDYAEKILKHFAFDRYCDVIYGSDFEGKLSKMDIIEKCMKDLGSTDYKNAVMIGDSWHDANGAEQLGVDFIGVTYGFDFRTEVDVKEQGAVGCAFAPKDLISLIIG